MTDREDPYLEPYVLRPTITAANYDGEPPPPQLVYEMQTPEAKRSADPVKGGDYPVTSLGHFWKAGKFGSGWIAST